MPNRSDRQGATDFSGRMSLRVPKSLHRALVFRARDEGVNLNKLAVAILSAAVGWDGREGGDGSRASEPVVEEELNEYGKPVALVEAERAQVSEMLGRIFN